MTEILDWTQKFAFGDPRPESKIRNIFIHTTENEWTTRAEDVAAYQIRSGSAVTTASWTGRKLSSVTRMTGSRGRRVSMA